MIIAQVCLRLATIKGHSKMFTLPPTASGQQTDSPASKLVLLDELVWFTLLEAKMLQMVYLLLLLHVTVG